MNLLAPFKTFILVAEHLNFSEAARRLNVPRATVSARIVELERQLGVRLLLRNTRHVSLTPEGEQYLFACQSAMAVLDDAEHQLDQGHALTGTVRLSVPASLPGAGFLQQLQTFQRLYPEITIELISNDKVMDLAEHGIDIAIRGKNPVRTDLVARPLPSKTLVLVATPEWCAAHLPISLWETTALHDPLRLCPFNRATPAIATSNLDHSLSLCLSGIGAALLPEPLCRTALAHGDLQIIPPPEPLPELPMFILYQQRKWLPGRVRVLIDFLMANG